MSKPFDWRRALRSLPARVALALVVLGALVAAAAKLELGRDLSSLNVAVLSGAPEGNYHRVVDRLAALAAARRGHLTNVATEGSVDNLARLEAARKDCSAAFAVVQDGQDWPAGLQLIGQLPRSESVLFVGKHADAITDFSSLRGLKIGIGPASSGTAKVASEILRSRDFDTLGLQLENHPLAEQLQLASEGKLDLAAMVIDPDAALVEHAVRDQGLQLASFAHADALVGRVPHVHPGRLEAGHYDPVRLLPPQDRTVLQVSTLLVGNGCAGRSRTMDFLQLVSAAYPDFIQYNREHANTTGLELDGAARSYFENGGPEVFDQYAPWLADIMPPGNWVYVVTAISVLFNLMGFGHRFQLWRIDANRVRMENELTALFGPTTTLGDIRSLTPAEKDRTPEILGACERLIHELEELAAHTRKMSLSPLVPMGQEMAYRYQEGVIHETLAVLRAFLKRARGPDRAAVA